MWGDSFSLLPDWPKEIHMNRIYKTIWNATRSQLVVVNECTTSHAQSSITGEGCESARRSSPVHLPFRQHLLATLIAGTMMFPLSSFAVPVNVDMDWDVSGGVTDWSHDGTSVQSGVTLTNNKSIVIQGVEFGGDPNAALKAGTLTNAGTITGDGKLEANAITNTGNITQGTIDLKTATGIDNKAQGNITVTDLKQGSGAVTNAGTLTLNAGNHTASAAITNSGTLNAKGLSVNAKLTNSGTLKAQAVTASAEINNTAAGNKVTLGSLAVTSGGSVTGTGDMKVNGAVNVSGATSFTQNNLTATGAVTNAGTMKLNQALTASGNVTNTGTMNVTGKLDAKGGLTNSKSATIGTLDANSAVNNASAGTMNVTNLNVKGANTFSNAGKLTAGTAAVEGSATLANTSANAGFTNLNATGTVTNSATGTINVTGALTVGKALDNKGTLKAGTANVTGTLKNDKTAQITTLNLTRGSITQTGATGDLTVTGKSTLAQGTALTQNKVTAAEIDASGAMTIGTLAASGPVNFKGTATGKVTSATLTGDMTHAGAMSFDALKSSRNITNTGGTLTVKNLTGASTVAVNAGTFDATGGSAAMSGLNTGANGTTKLNTATVTGDLSNAGTLTANGLVTARNVNQTGKTANYTGGLTASNALKVTGGSLTAGGTVRAATAQNTATMNVADLTVTTSMANSGNLTSTGTADINALTHSAGTANLVNATLRGTGSLGANVKSTGTLEIAANGSYTGAGTVNANVLNVNGDMKMTGAVSATGDTTIAASKTLQANGLTLKKATVKGTLDSKGTATIADLNMMGGSTLTNAGAMTVTKATGVAGVTYNQTGGSINFADNAWFSNSTLNVSGGTMARGANGLGSGNTYNISSSAHLGAFGPESSTGNDWKNGRTVVSVNTLDTGNTVNLNTGGLLQVNNINFAGGSGGKTLNFNGGALETTLSEFFQGVSTDALKMEAINKETGRIEIKGTSILGVTRVGEWQGGVIEHTNLTGGGDIVFKDAVSTDLIVDVNKRFAAAKGSGPENKDLTIHYAGKAATVFNIAKTNELLEQNKGSGDVGKVEFILDNTSLYARKGNEMELPGKTLTVGGTGAELQINDSVGFRNVLETEKVEVKGGAQLALVGSAEQELSLIGTNGSASVTGAGSKFTMGTNGLDNMKGKVNALTASDNGTILGKGGTFTVGSMTATAGKIETQSANVTTVNTVNLDGRSSMTNAGTMTIKTSLTDTQGAVTTNTGKLTIQKATDVKGTLKNDAGLTKVAGALTVSGKVTNGASVPLADGQTRVSSASMEADSLKINSTGNFENVGSFKTTGATGNVIRGDVPGSQVNSTKDYAFTNGADAVADFSSGKTTIGGSDTQTFAAGSVTNTLVMNKGGMKFADLSIEKGGHLFNYGQESKLVATNITMDAFSSFNNEGTVSAQRFEQKGTVRNKGTIGSQVLEITDLANTASGADGKGILVTKTLSVADNGSISNGKESLIDAAGADVNFGARSTGSNAGMFRAKTFSLGAGADFMNEGTLLTEDLTVMTGATQTNKGNVSFKNAVIEGNYLNDLEGRVTIGEEGENPVAVGGNLTIKGNGSYENRGMTTVINDVKISDNGMLLQSGQNGKFVADTVTIDGGKTVVTSGEFAITNYVDLVNGSFSVKGANNGEAPANASIMLKGDIEGGISVEQGSLKLGLWTPVTEDQPVVLSNTMPSASATLTADYAPITLGANGKIAVGTGSYDKLNSMNGGDAWFGGDSLFVIDTSKMTSMENGGTAALVGNGKGDLTIDSGAKLHVSNVGWGDYYVTKDFANEVLGEGSWQDNVTFAPDLGDKALQVKQDKDGNVILQVGSSNILDKLPDVNIPNIINGVITNPSIRDVNDKGVIGFISKSIEDGIIAEKDQADVINQTSNIGAAGGVMSQAMLHTGNVLDAIDRHMSYEDAHFKNGQLLAWEGARYWANGIGQTTDVSGLAFGKAEASFDGVNTGFVFGADLQTADGFRYGAAISAMTGNVKSNKALVNTENKDLAFGLTGYAAKEFGRINVIGTLGYTHLDSELSQTLPGSLGLGAHEMDQSAEIFTASVKAETRIQAEGFSFVPHVGLRSVTVMTKDETSTLGGKDAFSYESDTITQFQMPIGVSLEAEKMTASGWNTKGLLDVSVTPVFGDRETSGAVTAAGINDTDTLTTNFSDKVFGTVRAGLTTEKDGLTFGGELGLTKGETANGAVSVGLKARWAF